VHNRLRGLGYDRPSDLVAGLGEVGVVELGLRRLVVLTGETRGPDWFSEVLSELADRLVLSVGVPVLAGASAVSTRPTE
jgi:hypothetical protein